MSCFTAFHVCLMLHGFFHIPWVLMMCFSPIDVSKSLCWIDFGTTVFFGALVLRVPHCSTYYQGLLYNYILYIISYRYDWWLLGMTNIILGKKSGLISTLLIIVDYFPLYYIVQVWGADGCGNDLPISLVPGGCFTTSIRKGLRWGPTETPKTGRKVKI